MKTKHISRRHFMSLTSRGIGLAIVSHGLMGCLGSGSNSTSVSMPPETDPAPAPPAPVSFSHGVASGDPLQDAVILWTRVTPSEADFSGAVNVAWQLATDEQFSDIVTSGSANVSSDSDYTLKVDAIGLLDNTTYYYRFSSGDQVSPVGKTKTLPSGMVSSVKLAVMSCSNYPAGYFNVYDMAAHQNNLDAVLHLGDYIYEYARDGYASDNADALGRVVQPETEIFSLADYRTRYAQYRSDASLQKLHRNVPFIVVWDDHEVANDAYKDGAENHDESEGDYEARKLAALQAYFEWLPIRPVVENDNEIINRRFSFGDLVDLHMLDTRLIGRDQQLDFANYIDSATGALNAAQFTADVSDVNRTLLGTEQAQWLLSGLATSTATWQVLGQQVLMGRMLLPAAIATQQLSISQFAELATLAQLAARLQAGDPTLTQAEIDFVLTNQAQLTPEVLALLQLPNIPYNLDAWDGYAYERELILGTAKQLGKNLVVVAGDTHNGWANNLRDINGDIVGVEFATPSVSSPGLKEVLGVSDAEVTATEAGVVQLVEDLQYFNIAERGFMMLEFTAEKVRTTWLYANTISSTDYYEKTERRQIMESQAGNAGLVAV
ncbi:MAG: alkaline phosphatase D family protein [Aestuariibacter sp.]